MKTSNLLNLGCGTDIKKNYINLDKDQFKGVNIIWDVNDFPFPFPDNAFSGILINHVLEHVEDVVKTMEEVWRISKPDAVIKIGVPYFSGLNAVTDPTHRNFFAAATFKFFEKKIDNYFTQISKMDFQIVKMKIIFSEHRFLRIFNSLVNLNQKVYERLFANIFPSQTLEVELKVVKKNSADNGIRKSIAKSNGILACCI